MKSKEQKQKEAIERQKDYSTLTVAQKILKLDIKLGGGKGAVKERAKLARIAVEPVAEKLAEKPKKNYQKPKRS